MTISRSLLAVGLAVSAILGGSVHAAEYTATLLPGEEILLKPISYEKSNKIYDVSCADDVLGCGSESCDTGSCGNACQTCGDVGCGCGNGYGLTFVAGVEATFLAPIRDGQTDWLYQDIPNGISNSYTTSDNNVSIVPAPRIWLGFVNCYGWGAQIRYWELNDNALRSDPFVPFGLPAGDVIGYSAVNSLQMFTLDAEVTKNFTWGCWDLQAGFGYRHASLEVGDTAAVSALVARPGGIGGGTNWMTGTGASLYNFEGDGITMALTGYRPTCHGFDFFWSARGSVLFGSADALSVTTAQLSGPGGSAAFTSTGAAGGNDEIFIGELQVGTQWSHYLPCANACFFFRGAFEYQYWSDGSSRTAATSAVGETNVGLLQIASQSGGNSTMDLVGFTIATGITY